MSASASIDMRIPSPNMRIPSPKINLGRRGGGEVVGLDIQPGLVAAVQARVNGAVLAERAGTLPLGPDTVREGEVADEGTLSEALRELFAANRLGKQVRVGIANQRTVLRTLELPPVTDRKELDAAVRFQAQDQVPMPLNNALLDFHALGIVDTPAGARQRVVLVAAQRDMVERLLAAVRGAGLNPVGVDLSAFALIRSLYRPGREHDGRVLYLNVDGLTNLAIAERAVCRFTRVVGGGFEGMAGELAARRGIAIAEARELLATVDLREPAELPNDEPPAGEQTSPRAVAAEQSPPPTPTDEPGFAVEQAEQALPAPGAVEQDPTELASVERPASPAELDSLAAVSREQDVPMQVAPTAPDADVRAILENGIREIAGEVRNSLDFHRSQDGGGEVGRVVLSGSALALPGFAVALQASLGVEVQAAAVSLADESLSQSVSTCRLAVAAGLATSEVAQ
jgi:type IV pilus assembly protein PilM